MDWPGHATGAYILHSEPQRNLNAKSRRSNMSGKAIGSASLITGKYYINGGQHGGQHGQCHPNGTMSHEAEGLR